MSNKTTYMQFLLEARDNIKSVLNREKEHDLEKFGYYSRDGDDATENNYENCTINASHASHVYIDIYENSIDIDIGLDTFRLSISTEGFQNCSDEEFFMQSTLQDFSFFEGNEDVLKDLIKVSFLIRENNEQANN